MSSVFGFVQIPFMVTAGAIAVVLWRTETTKSPENAGVVLAIGAVFTGVLGAYLLYAMAPAVIGMFVISNRLEQLERVRDDLFVPAWANASSVEKIGILFRCAYLLIVPRFVRDTLGWFGRIV